MGERTSDPTGVIGCTEEVKNPTMACSLNHTIVEFRPNRAWRGEFGFDWLRVDDAPVTGHVPNEPPYKDCILGSKKSGYTKGTPNPAAYNDLKTEYQKLNVSPHRAAPKNEYFIPWLNLYAQNVSDQINNDYKAKNGGIDLPVKPPYEAELRLIVNVQGDTKPKELEIVFPSEYFTIEYPKGAAASGSPIKIPASGISFTPNSPEKNYDLPQTIKITCIKEFSKDQHIEVWVHHYEHNQAKLDQLEQENKQLNDTDIPALEQEIAALEAETKTLETEITTQEAKVSALEQPVKTQQAAIDTLEELCSIEGHSQITGELLLEAYEALSDEAKKTTDVADYKILNQPGEKEKLQEQINVFKAEAEKLEAEIKQKTAELEAPKKELEAAQAELEKKKTEFAEKQKQIEEKKKEVEQHQEKIKENTEEMNKAQGKSLAGKLCVCANDAKHRKTCKVLLVNVITNFDIATPPDINQDKKGILRPAEEEMLYNTLYQALIYPDVTKNILFDLSTDPKFKKPTASASTFVNGADEVASSTAGKFLDYLKTEFKNKKPTFNSATYWPVFIFGIDGEGMGGVAWVGKQPCSIFKNRNASAAAHEILHNLGLQHTHIDYKDNTYTTSYYVTFSSSGLGSITYDASKYIFNYGGLNTAHPDYKAHGSTTSVISYTLDRYSTYRWHWQIMRNHL